MTLQKKFIVFFSLFFVLFTLFSGIFSYFYLKNKIKNSALSELSLSVNLISNRLQEHFNNLKKRVVDWSLDRYLRLELEKAIFRDQSKSIEKINSYLKDKTIFDTVALVDIFDLNGIIIASSDQKRIGNDESKENIRFNEAKNLKIGEVELANFVIEPDELEGKSMTHLITPIFSFSKKEEAIGYLLIHVLTDEINKILSFQREFGYDFYLADKNKIMITPSFFLPSGIFTQTINTQPVKSCLDEGTDFSGSYLNFQDIAVIGVSDCLAEYSFILIGERRESDLLKSILYVRNIIIISGFLIGIFGNLMALYLSDIFLNNLNIIISKIKLIGEGNFKERLELKSGDELEKLAGYLNEMAKNLEKYYTDLDEANKELLEIKKNLEVKVKERTERLEAIKRNLEAEIEKRTKEISEKLEQLEKFESLAVGRELAMIKLKEEIKKLKQEYGIRI